MKKKAYSINDNYLKINLMIKKDLIEKIKTKTEIEKTTIKNFIENLLIKNL